MLLRKPAYPLARPAKDSRRPQRTLPAGTLVCEGHFLEYTHKRTRGQWRRTGALPDAPNEYYASKEVAVLAVDVPGSRCLGHFYRELIQIEDVPERQIALMKRPDQPAPLHAKKYSVSAECDAIMQVKIGIYN